jgi:serine/threonine-protein phosphatase 4 catalytic subunit
MTLLYLLKIKYPTNIYLLRGNHENKQITQVYGMYNEIHQNYGTINAWEDFCTSFDALPLCAIIDEKIFCVHGGLSPELLTNKTAPNYSITPIIELDRYNTNAYEGLAIDLVWSDPEEIQGWSIAPKSSGYLFGAEVVQQFHHSIGTDLLCRSHQLVMEGYKYMFDDGLITIWGAPNYCYRCGNVAAVLEVEGQERRTVVYDQSPKTMEHVKEQTQTQVNYFL